MLAKRGQWPQVAASEPMARVPSTARAERVEDYAFLDGRGVDRSMLESAIAEGRRLGVPAVKVLLARGWLKSSDYVAALAASVSVRPGAESAATGVSRSIDATASAPGEIMALVDRALDAGERPLLLDRVGLEHGATGSMRRRRRHRATYQLHRLRPDLSAAQRVAGWQLVAAVSVPGAVAGGLAVLPEATLVAIMVVAAVPFLFVVGLRCLALLMVLAASPMGKPTVAAPRWTAENGRRLPTYAVLIPLYREAEVLPGLLDAMAAIDYPVEKLDIVLVLEESDRATRDAAEVAMLPPTTRIVLVPDGGPRTKPKALNYALDDIAADLVVVYDAEDLPDPDQLRKAAARFRASDERLACLQARLTIYNPKDSWLTRQFTLEYAALFGGLLPALARLRLPVALGGTSNHFRRASLQALGGWDAHNVTEDADLGMRIARAGLRVEALDSETGEEMPATLWVWLRQRTRWQKGFMQTWAVHMRRPSRLLREVGPIGFVGVNAIIGGHVISALLHPLCIATMVFAAWEGSLLRAPQSDIEAAVIAVAVFNLVAGYLSTLMLAAVAAQRAGKGWLVWHLATTPLYWFLVSAAAWRALWQIVRDPYGWEKTPHTPRPAGQRRAQTP